jgi:hypothetical protein
LDIALILRAAVSPGLSQVNGPLHGAPRVKSVVASTLPNPLPETIMSLITLQKADWQAYFDRVSKSLENQRANIEVTGLKLGDQLAASQVVMHGVSHDPHDDTVNVFVEGLTHRIARPLQVHVDEENGLLKSAEVVDADGVHHILQLVEPLRLPAP